jgi:hypothetical protein
VGEVDVVKGGTTIEELEAIEPESMICCMDVRKSTKKGTFY